MGSDHKSPLIQPAGYDSARERAQLAMIDGISFTCVYVTVRGRGRVFLCVYLYSCPCAYVGVHVCLRISIFF